MKIGIKVIIERETKDCEGNFFLRKNVKEALLPEKERLNKKIIRRINIDK